MIIVTVKQEKTAKLKNRYGWVFADEIKEVICDRDSGIANVFSEKREFIGKGLFYKHSSKTVRMLTLTDEEIDSAFFYERIHTALQYRQRLSLADFYRLINAESDALPGLIIDRYGRYFVLQIRHPALEEKKALIIETLKTIFAGSISGIFERSDFESTPELGLNRNTGLLWGEVPEEIEADIDGIRYVLKIQSGQKTGMFLDQRSTRSKAREIVGRYHLQGKEALDLFCYTGGFCLTLAQEGMRCTGIDKSVEDIEIAKKTAVLNRLEKQIQYVCADVFSWFQDTLINPSETTKKYDMIILDPPSLIKSQKEKSYGKRILTELVRNSINVLQKNGFIGLCSCSYHLGWEEMIESARRAAADCGKTLIGCEQNIQSPDHPWLLQMPETLYLKCLWFTVS
jgi:23S rRNA (cytosine1962-C5)-methyltransferase